MYFIKDSMTARIEVCAQTGAFRCLAKENVGKKRCVLFPMLYYMGRCEICAWAVLFGLPRRQGLWVDVGMLQDFSLHPTRQEALYLLRLYF